MPLPARLARGVPLLLMAAAPAPVIADTIAVEAPIAAVTIHPGGVATVERSAQVTLKAGTHSLEVRELPGQLEPDSVQVRLAGDASAYIEQVGVHRVEVPEVSAPRAEMLREQLTQLRDERAAVEDRIAAHQTRLHFIEGLSKLPENAAKSLLETAPKPQTWQQMWSAIDEGATQARAALRAREAEKKRLGARIDALERELDGLEQTARQRYATAVSVRSEQTQQTTMTLRYRISGAHWQPSYQARLDTQAETLRLVRQAQIRQSTGEDWNGIKLTLSTARPVAGQAPGELSAWWIDLAEAGPRRERKAESDTAQFAAAAPPQPASAEIDVGAFAASYNLTSPVTLPADNQPRKVRIAELRPDTSVHASVTPQHNPRAWLTATATHDSAETLPGGPVERFVDGRYVGEAHMGDWPSNEALELDFGSDPGVTVSYEAIEDKTEEPGLIGSTTTQQRRYRLTLRNTHTRALPITIHYRIPTSRNDALEVSPLGALEKVKPKPDAPGVYTLEWQAQPGADKAWTLGYRLSYPEDRRLTGTR